LAEDRACQGVREDGVTANARRSRLSLAAVSRREREPSFLALVQVFSRLIRIPTLTLSTGSSHRTGDQNNGQNDEVSETPQDQFHGGSC